MDRMLERVLADDELLTRLVSMVKSVMVVWLTRNTGLLKRVAENTGLFKETWLMKEWRSEPSNI